MEAIIAWVVSEAWPYILVLLVIVGGGFALRRSGKEAGRQEAESRKIEADAKAREKANEIDREVSALDGDSVRRRAGDWVRRKDGR